jgi:ubiquinone/menaquinone biosynthesis C-methylase UbiE
VQADWAGSYVLADSAALPFPDRQFDLAVSYNSLQVVADMAGTVREAARALVPDGRFCACVAHPVSDLGRFREPRPSGSSEGRERWLRAPMFLSFRAVKS